MQVLRKAFKQPLDPLVTKFVCSVKDDAALIEADLRGSKAHAAMLASVGLINELQWKKLTNGLSALWEQYRTGKRALLPEHEDVHMNVEKALEETVGEAALRLHTARSRNDQVATDFRLYVHAEIEKTLAALAALQLALVNVAEANVDAVMPGYTHLQRAQPVSFAHQMHAFVEMLFRDSERMKDADKRVCVSPLGAGALVGSSLPVSPQTTAANLGMIPVSTPRAAPSTAPSISATTAPSTAPTNSNPNSNAAVFANSIDAVCDRDFAAEFLFCCSLIATHLSQLAETLIIWSSKEFGFVELSDAVTTTSSLMPQKKNADPLELIRSKSGAVLGDLVNVMTVLKGLPLGYNRDLQDTKPPVIHSSQSVQDALAVMTVVVHNLSVCVGTALAAASDPEMMATDLVEYLVNKGVPFRTAHEAVAQLVAHSRDLAKPLPKLPLTVYRQFAPEFCDDVYALLCPKTSVARKTSHGGTATANVLKALSDCKQRLS